MSYRSCRCLPVAFFLGCVGLAAATMDGPPAAWTNDLSPIAASDWTYEKAAHLLERAGFGGTPDDIQRLAVLTPKQAVDLLVDYQAVDNSAAKAFEESGMWDPG